MIKKIQTTLYSKKVVSRKTPANLAPGDEHLFVKANPVTLEKVDLFRYENLLLSPEGLVFKGLSLDEDLLIYSKHKKIYNFLYLVSTYVKRKKITLPKEENYLLIFDYWSNSIFHWMCDALPRLESVKELAKDCVLLLPENYEYPYIHESLKAYQFKSIFKIPVNVYLHCAQLLSPKQITVSGEVNPENIRGVRETILKYYKPLFKGKYQDPNIYISRAKAKYRKVLNEDAVLPLLEKYNFKLLYFEDLNFTEQVECCFHAQNMISIHGANLTNCLFMQNGGNVMEFRKKGDPDNNYFYAIADSIGSNYYYQNCEVLDHIPGKNFFDLTVNIYELEKNINLMLQNTIA